MRNKNKSETIAAARHPHEARVGVAQAEGFSGRDTSFLCGSFFLIGDDHRDMKGSAVGFLKHPVKK